ncbi:MAG: DUF397 domain-containing protein [Nocardioidaceae bacterium]
MNNYPTEPAGLDYTKASSSTDQQGCVEVAVESSGGRWVRDTKDRSRPAHYYTAYEWACFTDGVKAGEFD